MLSFGISVELCSVGLHVESIGNMSVQTQLVTKTMEGKLTAASINGVQLQFLVSTETQTVPQYTYSVPAQWRKFGLTPCHMSPAGINRIIIGLDNVNLLPDVLSSANGMQLSRSKLTRKLIVSGRAAAVS